MNEHKQIYMYIMKALKGEELSVQETRQVWNFIWDYFPKMGKWRPLYLLYNIFHLRRRIISVLSASAVSMIFGLKPTVNVLAGLYLSFKDHNWLGEENIKHLTNAVSSEGWGGEEIPTINVGTPSAIIAASVGVKVVKSGSRTFFSVSGFSDFLSSTSIPKTTELKVAEKLLQTYGLSLIEGEAFAPGTELIVDTISTKAPEDIRLIFRGLTYPLRYAFILMNPLRTVYAHRALGLPFTEVTTEALKNIHPYLKRVVCVFGRDISGRILDEVSTVGPTKVTLFDGNSTRTFTIMPEDLDLPLRKTEEIIPKSKEEGYKVIMEVLEGKRTKGDPYAELLAANVSSILCAAGKTEDLKEGVEIAFNAIEDGKPAELLKKYSLFFEKS